VARAPALAAPARAAPNHPPPPPPAAVREHLLCIPDWCPPCRKFTPVLAKCYEDAYKAKGMEIVFVSSDKDQASFDEYYGEQPWAAIPFANREAAKELGSKFKVQGIPTLVIIDGEGNTINADGRDAVASDPAGDNFPWVPPTKEEKAAQVLKALGDDIVGAAGDKPIALYFSAHWCPPCRGFTPKLAQMYADGLKENLEVVFVSSDKDQASFDTYAGEQPWPSLAFDKRAAAEALSSACGVEGLPTLVLLDKAGNVVTADGRAKVMGDQKGETIAAGGWAPKPFNDVNDCPDGLNEFQCLVALGADESMWAAVEAVAEEQCTAVGGDCEALEMRFFKAREGGVEGQLRQLTGLPRDANRLILIDIPDNGAFYECEEEASIFAGGGKASVEEFLAGVKDGKVPRKQFKQPEQHGHSHGPGGTCGHDHGH